LLTALRVLEAMRESGQDLDSLTSAFVSYPQLLVNVRVKERRPLAELASVNAGIERAQGEFGEGGRVLVRFSGTEPLARVMVEGPALDRVTYHAHAIADAIGKELGVALA
jgi:phosphoglucosamine mutase